MYSTVVVVVVGSVQHSGCCSVCPEWGWEAQYDSFFWLGVGDYCLPGYGLRAIHWSMTCGGLHGMVDNAMLLCRMGSGFGKWDLLVDDVPYVIIVAFVPGYGAGSALLLHTSPTCLSL